jgi:hypothetical protein
VVNATPWLLYSREKDLVTTGGWVGPRAGLDGCIKSCSHRDSIARPSSPEQVPIPTELSQPTSCNIYVLKTIFFLTFLYFIQCLGTLPLARTPTQDFPTKVLLQSRIWLLGLQPMVWKPQPCHKPLHYPVNKDH